MINLERDTTYRMIACNKGQSFEELKKELKDKYPTREIVFAEHLKCAYVKVDQETLI